jgi:hypothetical protein
MALQIKSALPFDKKTVSVALSKMDTEVVPIVTLPAIPETPQLPSTPLQGVRLPRLNVHSSWLPLLISLSGLCVLMMLILAFYTVMIVVILLGSLLGHVGQILR